MYIRFFLIGCKGKLFFQNISCKVIKFLKSKAEREIQSLLKKLPSVFDLRLYNVMTFDLNTVSPLPHLQIPGSVRPFR